MLTVSEYRDLPSIDGIRDLWRQLWWKTPRASFFQSIEWFESHCRKAAGVHKPRVFVVAAAGRPVGLVPWVEKRVWGPVGRLRVLSDAPAALGFSRGSLGSNPDLTLETVLNHTRAKCRWDRLELRHVELGSRKRTLGGRRIDPALNMNVVKETRILVECRGDWVRYLRSLPDQVREQYQRSERELAEQGKLEYVRYRPEGTPLHDGNPRWEIFGELERAQNGFDKAAEKPEVAQDIHEAATSVAGVDLNLLRLNGKPIAWAYNYRCDGRIKMQRVRTAGEFASAAGSALLGRMLCDGFRRGDESYLFDTETSRLAAGWQTAQATSYRRIHHPRSGARVVRLLAAFNR